MHRFFVCVAVFCALSLVFTSVSSAQPFVVYQDDVVAVSHDAGVPTVDLEGYTTYTVTVESLTGAGIFSFDFFGTEADPRGFFGSMNQINPNDAATIFGDANSFMPLVGADVSQDSQFLFESGNFTIPSGFTSEGDDHLRATFASGVSLGTRVDVAQLAIPNDATGTVDFVGQVSFDPASGISAPTVAGTIPVPEPASLALVSLALVGAVGLARRRR